jgi:hypothetical protein
MSKSAKTITGALVANQPSNLFAMVPIKKLMRAPFNGRLKKAELYIFATAKPV